MRSAKKNYKGKLAEEHVRKHLAAIIKGEKSRKVIPEVKHKEY